MDFVPYLLSSLSLLVAIIALWKGFRDSSVAERENDYRARQQYNAEVRIWAGECTDALSGAVYLAAYGPSDQNLLQQTISALSALLEQGRLFFPNNPLPPLRGHSTKPVHEGERPRILDWLVFALRICATMRPERDPEAEAVLKRLQAGYTGDVQLVLDPRNPLTKMSDLPRLLRNGEFMDSSQAHPDIVRASEFVQQRKIHADNRDVSPKDAVP